MGIFLFFVYLSTSNSINMDRVINGNAYELTAKKSSYKVSRYLCHGIISAGFMNMSDTALKNIRRKERLADRESWVHTQQFHRCDMNNKMPYETVVKKVKQARAKHGKRGTRLLSSAYDEVLEDPVFNKTLKERREEELIERREEELIERRKEEERRNEEEKQKKKPKKQKREGNARTLHSNILNNFFFI